MLQKTIKMIQELVGKEALLFETALEIKASPHMLPVNLWGVHAFDYPKEAIYLMDANQQWYELSPSDVNYKLVLTSLHQRIKFLHNKLKTAI